jgi:hypothetical protein
MSFHPKPIVRLRSGIEKRPSSGEAQKSTFARFLGLFDFRLLQQYRHISEIWQRPLLRRCRGTSGHRLMQSIYEHAAWSDISDA